MNKPFDLSDLAARLKAKALPMVEADLKIATAEIFAWAQESCVLEGGFAALAAPMFPMVLAQIVVIEDKIDGVAGN